MDNKLLLSLVVIGLPFCLAGGVVAFLTAYTSHTRGQNPDKRLAMRLSLQTALIALVALVILISIVAFILVKIILK